MKLRELLTGSVAVVALAGVASAQNDVTATVGGTAAPVAMASELSGDVSGVAVTLDVEPQSTAHDYPSGNLEVIVTLTGGTFAAALTAGSFGTTGCTASAAAIADGGGKGDSSVTLLFSDIDDCSTGTGNLDVDFTMDSDNNDDVSVSVAVQTELGSARGGGTGSEDLIEWESAFDFSLDAAGTAPEATLASDFEALTSSTIGSVTLDDEAGTQYDTDGFTAITVGGATPTVTLEIEGDFTGIEDVDFAGDTEEPASGAVELEAVIGGAGTFNIDFNPFTGTNATAIAGGTFDAEATVSGTGYTSGSDTAELEIDREGTDILFSFTLDDTTMSSFEGAFASYRISNTSSAAMGAVSIQLKSWDNTPTETGMVELAASIPANGDLVFTPADVEALVGAYGIGDFVVNVEGAEANLEADYAIVNADGTTNYKPEVGY